MKEYRLRWYSQLGTQRKPSVTNLLLEQKNNFIFNYRKLRETSKKNCNCIYLKDIDKYAFICATLIKNTDISLGVIVIDDNDFEKQLNIRENQSSKNISINLYDTYKREEIPYLIPLEIINRLRQSIKENSKSHNYLNPLSKDQYDQNIIIETITLDILK